MKADMGIPSLMPLKHRIYCLVCPVRRNLGLVGDYIMNRIKCFTLVALALGSATVFAAQDRSFNIQNTVRVGYDDNIYQTRDVNKQGTAFIADIVNISGEFVFSDRSEMELYWQPELRYRFDADPEAITYQDLYGRLSHAVSQRTFLELSDRLRYQEKDGQSDLVGGDAVNQNFLENDLMGSLGFTLSPKNQIKLGGGYEFRTWDDDGYGEWNPGTTTRSGNNYDQLKADGSYVRELKEDTTHAMVGVNYVNHEYDGARGGFDSTTLYGGVDHAFNPKMSGTAQLGWSLSSVDWGENSEDTSSPFLETGLTYQPTDRTSINGSLGYSLSQSQSSFYNAQEGFDVGLGVRHDLTGKITLSGTLSYIFSMYDSAYGDLGLEDAEENYLSLSLRGSYQINRNNFIDIGYEISQRDSDSPDLTEYTRSRVDIGWRLRL